MTPPSRSRSPSDKLTMMFVFATIGLMVMAISSILQLNGTGSIRHANVLEHHDASSLSTTVPKTGNGRKVRVLSPKSSSTRKTKAVENKSKQERKETLVSKEQRRKLWSPYPQQPYYPTYNGWGPHPRYPYQYPPYPYQPRPNYYPPPYRHHRNRRDDDDDDDDKNHYDDDSYEYSNEEDYYYYAHYYWYNKYTFQPTDPAYVVDVTGGVGGRSDRKLEDIRFNKCPPVVEDHWSSAWRYKYSREYLKGVHQEIFPLLPDDYPIGGETSVTLRTETMADSPMLEGDMALDGVTAEDYLGYLKEPYYPSSDPNNPFWKELEHVVDVQIARRAKKDPTIFSHWSTSWKDYSIAEMAQAVHNEYPASLQQALLDSLFKSGIKMDHDIMPFRSVVDIVGTQFLIASLNTWAFESVAAISFLLKWTKGVPRPEEMAWLIAIGDFTAADGVPQGLIDKIKSMNLQHAADFTEYEEGSPMHPSWPAMHAAGSVCACWLPLVVRLTPEQYCEALRVDLSVAYGRTMAGVHYRMDNFAGLNLGTAILRNKFPKYMAGKYGCEEDKIAEKMEYLSFDWHDFDPYNCTIAGVTVEDHLNAYYTYHDENY